ncbi:hypothetical protein [Butyrivibrio sp. VCB2006]|uniref:hypothetical protein n=1 Tax=Butyrivibrio sp. VCB2006 TaxID=1280679 RepID=UPI00040A6530|nr:hypothetical protein [Butyrivibrio sp. VCB2006]
MKKTIKKIVCIVLVTAMCMQLVGCGKGYTTGQQIKVEFQARNSARKYLLQNKFGAIILNVKRVAPFVWIYEDALYNEAVVTYWYKGEKHKLLVNNDDGSIYLDDYLDYAEETIEKRLDKKLGLSETERTDIDYHPNYDVVTTKIYEHSHGETHDSKDYFPGEYTREDVDKYISEDDFHGNVYNTKIFSDRSCEDFQEMLPIKKYMYYFNYQKVNIYCNDGYVEYSSKTNDRDDKHKDILITVYKKDSVTYEDKVDVRIEYYDEFCYRYSFKNGNYALAERIFTDINKNDFEVKFGKKDDWKIMQVKTRRNIDADVYIKDCNYRHVRVKSKSNGYEYERRYSFVKADDGWKKMIFSKRDEKMKRDKYPVQEKSQGAVNLDKDAEYTFSCGIIN